MLAVNGYYDGVAFLPLEKVNLKKNQRVIITILDNIVDNEALPNKDTLEALNEVEYMKKHPEENKGFDDVDKMMEELLK